MKAFGFLYAGGMTLLIGWIWSHAFPINKSLWTSSYVLLSAGLACLVLAATYWLVDVKGFRRWTWPFLVFGTNAIAAYWLSTLIAIVLDWLVVAGPETESRWCSRPTCTRRSTPRGSRPLNASLAYAVCYVLLWLGLLSVLYRRRIFIRI